MLKISPPIGATLIIAGTTIGAGMLALPIISHGLGFGLMAFLMILTWGFMGIAALFTLEANLAIKPGCSLFVMATETLGNTGRLVAVSAMIFLFYALMAAYISAGGEQMGNDLTTLLPDSFSTQIELAHRLGIALFTLFFGAIAVAGVQYIDLGNRLLFIFMLGAFCVALSFLAPEAQPYKLHTFPANPWQSVMILPVIFTSFGYHGNIPSLIAYVGPNKKQLQRIFLLGSLIPLLLYLIWLGVALGQLDNTTLAKVSTSGSVPELIDALSRGSTSYLLPALHIFTNLALITSFLGVALGLFDFMHSALASQSRLKTALVVYLPPLAIAILLPGAFVIALSYAALALAVLAILLPAAMLYQLHKQNKIPRYPGRYLFWPTLAFGIAICLLSLVFS
ncbi:aromatic amino acid transport family protein [Sansalvadorimonas verongulae]|uniref:aromatic amino acid transport family protein n=1 Tax=Sansalvadorimonas verongulae TaxID=2172824 RepID=UPI0018AD2224|nr:aromatic amino acid transport family protein [Sansalvadorimonas verongulae]